MQKVTAKLPSWETTKTQGKKGLDKSWETTKVQGKKGFDKVWAWADKLGAPINRLSNRIGSEAFWPTTLDKESDKAARILRSFCKDGFYTEIEAPADGQAPDGPKQKQRVLKKIPARVIQRAVGLAIFTTMRTGLWVSGAGGSGVLVARTEDGSWSPPSGILLHTAGLGFLVGVDIYDCVLVINNRKALEAFTKIRATLGGEISAVAGPVGAGGVLENDGKWKEANRPVFTYLKSRGFYAGVQVDGTIIIERSDENKRFYDEPGGIGVADILAGRVRHRPDSLRMLMETLKAAEGRTDVDAELLAAHDAEPAPGDVDVDAPGAGSATESRRALFFGVPEPDDPDPYGVLALEKQGLEVREAATRSRPPSQQFEFHPSPTSPVYNAYHRRRSSSNFHRDSGAFASSSRRSPYVPTVDAATQTDPVIILPVTAEEATDEATDEAAAAAAAAAEQPAGTTGGGLVVPLPDAKDDESVYEDVAEGVGRAGSRTASDAGEASATATKPAVAVDNPWVADDGDDTPYAAAAEDKDGQPEDAQPEDGQPHDANGGTKGAPPPLPPRNSASDADPPKPEPEFEEVALDAGKDKDGKP